MLRATEQLITSYKSFVLPNTPFVMPAVETTIRTRSTAQIAKRKKLKAE